MYDLIIIGGGPAGVMCAIQAQQQNKKILLIEKNNELLKKFKLTGNGRSNILNLNQEEAFLKHIHHHKFFYSSLKKWNTLDVYHYFHSIGIPLKEENHHRVYPTSDSAKQVATQLIQQIKHVSIHFNEEVLDIQEGFILTTNQNVYQAKKVVIATGGLSFPSTGSTGSGYAFAEKLNHEITPTYPVESPIVSNAKMIQDKVLQGLTLKDVVVSVYSNNKKIDSYQHDLLFTHFGISGPVSLGVSENVYLSLSKQKQTSISIDFLPSFNQNELLKMIQNKNTSLLQLFKPLLPERLLLFLMESVDINATQKISEISNKKQQALFHLLKNFTFFVHGIKPIQYAFITGGGIHLKNIHPTTFESKLIPNLYFIGEVLDLHGKIGGYNLSLCWIEGYIVGSQMWKI